MQKAKPINQPNNKTLPRTLSTFLLRWAVSTLAMYICIHLFATITHSAHDTFPTYLLAGLIFALVNSIIKPFLTLLSLPFIVLTLGLFVLVVNAAMVGITIALLPDISITFGGAILSALTISLINYLVNFLVPSYTK